MKSFSTRTAGQEVWVIVKNRNGTIQHLVALRNTLAHPSTIFALHIVIAYETNPYRLLHIL